MQAGWVGVDGEGANDIFGDAGPLECVKGPF